MNVFALVSAFFSFLKTGGADTIIRVLQGAGILKDPAEEAEIRRQLAIERAQWVQMTTPPWERVALWANTFVAVTRPGMAWVLVLTLAFFPSRLIESIKTLHEAGTLGLAIVAIILWSFYGRSLEKGVELWFTALAIKWGGPAAAQQMPSLVATLPAPEPSRPALAVESTPPPPPRPQDLDRFERVDSLTREIRDRHGPGAELTEFDEGPDLPDRAR